MNVNASYFQKTVFGYKKNIYNKIYIFKELAVKE